MIEKVYLIYKVKKQNLQDLKDWKMPPKNKKELEE